MSGFTDIHAHFLYGVDDGAQTESDMRRMLDAAAEDGVSKLYATPHVTPGLRPIEWTLFEERLAEARSYCRSKGYSIALKSGSEILYTPALIRYARHNKLPTLGGGKRILLEFAPRIPFREIDEAVEKLTRVGYRVILAHIERYHCMYWGNAFLLKRRRRVWYQVNCSSVLGRMRPPKRWELGLWFRRGLIDYMASDAHNCENRPTRMTRAYEELIVRYGERTANRLMGVEEGETKGLF